ncbi:MAG: Chitin synthase, class 5 [Pycnora praestabilis]|nr:MAG: Chitin synthase, class 5 [Pycnora praestabilis]
MLISLTVGKVDAGVAVLLTEDKRLIEFPSILLPPNISSGSIVDITVGRNFSAESRSQSEFTELQDAIHTTYGEHTPAAPILRCRNATQTSVVLEWDPIQLATAEIRSLSLYRGNSKTVSSKAGTIPRPLEIQSTKISGLAVDTEYFFHLILRTSAGTYSSEKLSVKTHKMTDLSGITITPGVLPAPLRDSLQTAVERIGAKLIDTVRIDTTHFVCTEGRGQAWERAGEMNIPVVRPEWVEGCEREGRIVGVRGYYLNADPRLRQVGQGVGLQQQQQQLQQQQQNTRPASQAGAQRAVPIRQSSQQQQKPLPTTPSKEDNSQLQEPSTTPGTNGTNQSSPSPSPTRPQDSQSDTEPPEPKTATDDPKFRREDRDQLERSISNAPTEVGTLGASESGESRSKGDGEHTPGDVGSFSEVAL